MSAAEDGSYDGVASLLLFTDERNRHTAVLDVLAVRPEARKRGTGTALWAAARAELAADGRTSVSTVLDPFGGGFVVHGAEVEVREGEWPGYPVVIGFPGIEQARAWYDSDAYQEILPLRTRHITGDVILVEGVAPGYDASVTAARIRQASHHA